MRWLLIAGLSACCPGAGLPPTPAEGAQGADLVPTASHAVMTSPPAVASGCASTEASECPPAAVTP